MYPIEPIFYNGTEPIKSHEDDAAFDLKAAACPFPFVWLIEPGRSRLIATDTRISVPDGHVGLVCSRSGLAANHGLFVLNAPGVIDPGYRGEIGVLLMNVSNQSYTVEEGDRIAQLLILPNSNFRMIEGSITHDRTDRGADGFGSTGINSAPLYGRSDLPEAS